MQTARNPTPDSLACHPAWNGEAVEVRDPEAPILPADSARLDPGQPLRDFRDDTEGFGYSNRDRIVWLSRSISVTAQTITIEIAAVSE
jgi:hypothetical protein